MTFGATETLVIRKATPADLDAIKAIADAHRHELGFVLRPALAESIGRGEVLVAENHQGLIGFAEYHHRRDAQTTLYHIAVIPQCRQQGVGRALVNALCAEASALGKLTVFLKCPADLSARGFYACLGFEVLGEEPGNGRSLIVWTLSLTENTQKTRLFRRVSPYGAEGQI